MERLFLIDFEKVHFVQQAELSPLICLDMGLDQIFFWTSRISTCLKNGNCFYFKSNFKSPKSCDVIWLVPAKLGRNCLDFSIKLKSRCSFWWFNKL